MLGDLGIYDGSRPDRHETFRQHYPEGYRMDFVSYGDVDGHAGLQAAFALHDKNHPPTPEGASNPEIIIEMSED